MFAKAADHTSTIPADRYNLFLCGLVVKAKLTAGQMSMDFSIMTARMSVGEVKLPDVRLLPLVHAAGWCL